MPPDIRKIHTAKTPGLPPIASAKKQKKLQARRSNPVLACRFWIASLRSQ
ncbi:MAG TPA: hypothetical protein VGO01_20905 [Bradyrhizobium sp.]|nr:hypothetical protein [Bradyrhizobium sp.]